MSRQEPEMEKQTEIESIIDLCISVQSGNLDPFDADVGYILDVIRKNYPNIKNFKDLCLDAKALKEVSSVLEHQSDWIQHQSTTLYKDPFMLNQQLLNMDIGAIADSLLKSWHPIVEMKQISAKTLASSMGYWRDLIPIEERWKESDLAMVEAKNASRDDARLLGLLPDEGFTEMLEALWRELSEEAGKGGKIPYWDWIGRKTYEETLRRAYLTCFMVSYGYANMKTDRFGENITIIHNMEPRVEPDEKFSLPILIDYEEWQRWREE
jgi:hypothetical protein